MLDVPPGVGIIGAMNSAKAVKAIREATKLTQAQFGEIIGVSARRVSQVEAGGGAFRPKPLLILCRKWRNEMASLGITPLDFYRVEPPTDDSRPNA